MKGFQRSGKVISSYIYIKENNVPLIEIEAGLIRERFST